MMQLAKKKDFPAIRDIWQEAFGDTEEEIADFFAAFAGKGRICIWKEEGQIAGQLVLLPVLLCTPKCNIPVEYIYAVATKKAYRNRGVCKELLAAAGDMLRQEGKPAVLVPADKGLAAFYKRNGFIDGFTEEKLAVTTIQTKTDVGWTAGSELQAAAFPKQQVSKAHTVPQPDSTDAALYTADSATYIALRKRAFAGKVHIAQPDELLYFALSLKLAAGSRIGKLTCNGKEYGVLYRKPVNAGEPIMFEEITAASAEEAVKAAQHFCGCLGIQQGILQRSYETLWLENPTSLSKEGFRESSVKPLMEGCVKASEACFAETFNRGYFNLVMD